MVALALIGGTPKSSSAGKVIKVPPPAIELSTPPKNPATKRNSNSTVTVNRQYNGEEIDNNSFSAVVQATPDGLESVLSAGIQPVRVSLPEKTAGCG